MLTIQFVLFKELSSNYLEIEDNIFHDAIDERKKRPQNHQHDHYSEQVLFLVLLYFSYCLEKVQDLNIKINILK